MHNTFKLIVTLTQQEIREWSQPHWWKRYHSVNFLPWKDLLSVLTLLCGHWLQAWVCCLPRGQSPNLGSQVVKRKYSGQTLSSVNLQLLNVVVVLLCKSCISMSLKKHSVFFFILAMSHVTMYNVKGVPYHDTPVLICGYINWVDRITAHVNANQGWMCKHDIVLQWQGLTCSFISVFHLLWNVKMATVERFCY